MDKVTIRLTDNTEIHLPKNIAKEAGFEENQQVLLCPVQGGLLLSKCDEQAEMLKDIAHQLMDQFDEELKILADK